MLILTRRIGESIIIGEDIAVTILGYQNNGTQVRVGISAPKGTPVHRQEVFMRILQEKLDKEKGESNENKD